MKEKLDGPAVDPEWLTTLLSNVKELVRDHEIRHAKFTEAQIAECFAQALRAGDFVRYIKTSGYGQTIKYIPFQEKQALQNRIRDLEFLLSNRSCCCAGCTKHNLELETQSKNDCFNKDELG